MYHILYLFYIKLLKNNVFAACSKRKEEQAAFLYL